MRLSKVEYVPNPGVVSILHFYMGKNTPKRKVYIMDKLVVRCRSERKRGFQSFQRCVRTKT